MQTGVEWPRCASGLVLLGGTASPGAARPDGLHGLLALTEPGWPLGQGWGKAFQTLETPRVPCTWAPPNELRCW